MKGKKVGDGCMTNIVAFVVMLQQLLRHSSVATAHQTVYGNIAVILKY
jgi:hypothetical protein